jgi:hypothetical protein
MPRYRFEHVETTTTVRTREFIAPTVEEAELMADDSAELNLDDWTVTHASADAYIDTPEEL